MTLQLQDGAQNLGTASFNFTLSASSSSTNSSVILIPQQGPATTYPSTLTVAGVTGAVSKVTVTLNRLTHTYPDDLDILLVGPAGQKVMLLSDLGSGISVTDVTLTFDDSAAPISPAAALASGTYHPTDNFAGETLPAPAPAGPYGTSLSVFNGLNPNGTWSLFVADDTVGDQGRINGWSLSIQSATPVAPAADLGVTVTAPTSTDSGAPISYVFTVGNFGPAAASGVVLTDTFPTGFVLGSVNVSQGSFSTGAGTVTANVGSLAPGATATVTVNGAGVGPRTLTNVVSVTAAQIDVNLANNSVTRITVVSSPRLRMGRAGNNVVISWLSPATGYVLEKSANSTGPWASAGASVTVVNGVNQVTVPATGTAFYRLRRP